MSSEIIFAVPYLIRTLTPSIWTLQDTIVVAMHWRYTTSFVNRSLMSSEIGTKIKVLVAYIAHKSAGVLAVLVLSLLTACAEFELALITSE